jgi:hypothetical protein
MYIYIHVLLDTQELVIAGEKHMSLKVFKACSTLLNLVNPGMAVNQQHGHPPLGACEKCRLPEIYLHLLNWNLHFTELPTVTLFFSFAK